MSHECLYCHAKLEARRVSRVQEYQGRWFLIENLPALVCPQCGAVFYTPEAHSLALRLVRASRQPVRVEQMEVVDASQAP
jgi:YgiT-type zinc finger domain-containing protein